MVPVLIGSEAQVREKANSLGVSLDGVVVRDPATDPRRGDFEADYLELRRHKGMTPEKAKERVALPHFFGALAVRAGEAAGMVSGLNSETKPFIPAFEIVKMQPAFKRASSVFVMAWHDKVYFYADCSMNIAPDAETLAEIGRATAQSARAFGYEPRVAFLSFSTRDSAKDVSIDRAKEAVALVREAGARRCWSTARCSSMRRSCPRSRRRSARTARSRARRTCSSSPTSTRGTSPTRSRERLGGAAAIGPIFQGLNKPVNDVSRGCSVQDFADVAAITALQSMR